MRYFLILLLFSVSFADDHIPDYKRKYFKHWVDVDRDCQDTRAEVLIRDAIDGKVMFKVDGDKQCQVVFGMYYDHYSGKLIPSYRVDIEHLVPLKNAWISGAYKWSPKKRELFANYMKDEWHLLAVDLSWNRSKSAKSPDQWMPPDKNFWEFYCLKWIDIKVDWGLTVTQEELNFIKGVLNHKKYRSLIYPEVR